MSDRQRHLRLLLGALLFTVAACASPGGTPEGSTLPDSPSATPAGPEIDHLMGATDVVLRFEEGGGFVPLGFLAAQAPSFTLYGDGVVLFRDYAAPWPQPVGNVQLQLPYMAARLSEDQVQTLLEFAIGPGGLGIARASYVPGNVADAPTAIFTLNAGGLSRTVSVNALGFDNPQSPDAVILRQLAAVGERLRSFSSSAPGAQPWVPDRYRGVLGEAMGAPAVEWPWPDITPADFVLTQFPDRGEFTARTMTAEEAEASTVDGYAAGFTGLVLAGPDGALYGLTLRPLLPDEPK